MAISVPGIGSNLDVDSIVSQLMALEQRPLTVLAQKEAVFQARLSAYGSLSGQLSSFQSAMSGLNDVNRFLSVKASIADTKVAGVTAANDAAPGSYVLEVSQRAQPQKLVATGQASSLAAIGTGTITFEFGEIAGGTFDSGTGRYTGATFTAGDQAAATVTIGANDGSLAGIRNAINDADIGVRASIINDGSGTPFRLALTVDDPGKANSLRISVAGDAALSDLLSHDPAGTQNLAQTAAATNAELSIDGVAISKPTNTVTDAVEGVTINLLATNPGSPTTITVARDTGAITGAVQSFVGAYNTLNSTIRDLSGYDAAAQAGGLLQGDSTVILLQSRIRRVLGEALSGTPGQYNLLSQVGVSFQKDGTLKLDSAKLQAAVDDAPEEIAALFANAGSATDPGVRYAGAGSATRPGSYQLEVTQLATRASQTGSAAAGLAITTGVNDQFSITVDGVGALVTLAAGNYASAADLAREVQTRINATPAFAEAGAAVTVTESGGVLTLTSARYGSESAATITSGTAMQTLVGATPVTTAGLDAAGTLNGSVLSGSGQRLTDTSSNDSGGIEIDVIGGTTGARGLVNYSTGYASRLDALIEDVLASTGSLAARTEGINASIEDIDARRQAIGRRLQDTETRLRTQFAALDALLGQLSATSNFLTQQLAKLDATTSSS